MYVDGGFEQQTENLEVQASFYIHDLNLCNLLNFYRLHFDSCGPWPIWCCLLWVDSTFLCLFLLYELIHLQSNLIQLRINKTDTLSNTELCSYNGSLRMESLQVKGVYLSLVFLQRLCPYDKSKKGWPWVIG